MIRSAMSGLLAAMLGISAIAADKPVVNVIPKPEKVKLTGGSLTLGPGTAVKVSPGVKCANLLAEFLAKDIGLKLKKDAGNPVITLKIDKTLSNLGDEGYKLVVSKSGIAVSAPTDAGVFYGIETLRQLIPPNSKTPVNIPCVAIEDKPAFPFRALMLDCSRFFYDAEYVKRYIDMMALHKLNKFHWHFIDDPGWRPEIKKYPKLTKIGAFRGKGANRYGGFYTQKQMRDVVAYAAARHIEIIPEIELPAHTMSAVAAYPWLGCFNKKIEVPNKHFISKETYCAGKDTTFDFLKDVFDELCAIFPGKFVHIGGDEAKYDHWEKCRACQARMKKEGLKSGKELQGWMTRKVEKMLAAHGKTLLGWDELLSCGVAQSAGLMIWYRPDAAKKGAELGHPIVMALTSYCYFDTPESKLPGEPKAATWIPPVSLKKAYSWDPMPGGLSAKGRKSILGPEGCVWSDQLLNNKCLQGKKTSEEYVMYLTLPRVAALAEVGWTPKNIRSWNDFSKRTAALCAKYDKLGYNYRVPLPEFNVERAPDGSATYTLKNIPVAGGAVRYETSGKTPTKNSPVLKDSVKIPKGGILTAITITPSGKTSLVFDSRGEGAKYAKYGTQIGKWDAGALKGGKTMPFDATGLISKTGTYQITFIQTSGSKRVKTAVSKVEIWMNGRKKIAGISKKCTVSLKKTSGNTYNIKVAKYETGASFEIKATMKSTGKGGGKGIVMIKKK